MESCDIDLGKKSEALSGSEVATAPKSPEKYFPSLYLDNVDLGDLDLPKEGKLLVSFRVKSETSREDDRGETHSCELEILSIDGVEGAKEKRKTASDDFDSRMESYKAGKDEE
jgi:hypothetical protein